MKFKEYAENGWKTQYEVKRPGTTITILLKVVGCQAI